MVLWSNSRMIMYWGGVSCALFFQIAVDFQIVLYKRLYICVSIHMVYEGEGW
jgi:hypothetical protein